MAVLCLPTEPQKVTNGCTLFANRTARSCQRLRSLCQPNHKKSPTTTLCLPTELQEVAHGCALFANRTARSRPRLRSLQPNHKKLPRTALCSLTEPQEVTNGCTLPTEPQEVAHGWALFPLRILLKEKTNCRNSNLSSSSMGGGASQ